MGAVMSRIAPEVTGVTVTVQDLKLFHGNFARRTKNPHHSYLWSN
jgi:hypothetical protein